MNIRPAIAIVLSTWSALSSSQTTIYESKDKAGPVFSDQPSFTDQPSAAKPIVVPPPNLSQGVRPPPQPAPSAATPPYSMLTISTPADGDTIHTNTGAFDIRAQSTPALRAAKGDRIRVKLDGNLLAASYRSGRISLTAADWQAAAENVDHTLEAAIVDTAGNVLIESAPVKFFAHRATVRRSVR
ncbi:MAG TPA: hypothetical protein VEW70_12750 [Burkholderiales bacterium]|nr:hypothetical protein [Burkholderiales bacterium]